MYVITATLKVELNALIYEYDIQQRMNLVRNQIIHIQILRKW